MAYNPFNPIVNQYNPIGNQGYNYQYPQPTPQTYQSAWNQQQNTQPVQLIQVNGLGGAQNYQLAPNSRIALFDANTDVFYIKTTDAGGYPTIQAFQFQPIANEQGTPTEFVTRSEFEELKEKVEKHVKQSVSETSAD